MSAAESRANEELGQFRAMEQIKQAGYYRHLTACAQGLGYPSITDALSALAAFCATPAPQADAAGNARDAALYRELNTPEIANFVKGVEREAMHQRARWGSEHDAGKAPEDWFWLLGYLGGKALHAVKTGNPDKALHHTISSAAALLNWHAAILGTHSAMRPGIERSDLTKGKLA